jgi:hypothetical protein
MVVPADGKGEEIGIVKVNGTSNLGYLYIATGNEMYMDARRCK